MKKALLFLLLLASTITAQDNRIAQFTVWEPKENLAQDFRRGYQAHVLWRKKAGDAWEWYGWYFTSGPRIGQFLEGTFNHAWSDFDNPVDPTEESIDSQANVEPYAYARSRFKAFFLKDQSIFNSGSLRSKMMRLVTITVTDMPAGVRIVDRYKNNFRSQSDVSTLMAFKVVDGGNANQIMLLIGSNSWEQYGKTENIQDQLANTENGLKLKGTIDRISIETLAFHPEMSLIPE